MKGYQGKAVIPKGSKDQKATLDWFFRRTHPFARKVFEVDIANGYQLKGCFITSGRFSREGEVMLDELNKGSMKLAQLDCYYDGEKLLELLTRLDFDKAATVLQRYYLDVEKAGGHQYGS